MNQKELELKAIELENNQTELIGAYIEAVAQNKTFVIEALRREYIELHYRLKAIHRRLTLLKGVSNETL